MTNFDRSKRPTKSIFGLFALSLMLFACALFVGMSNEVEIEQPLPLSVNESKSIKNPIRAYSKTTKEFQFVIPATTPNAKLIELGNSNEYLSVFKVGNRVNLVFTEQGKDKTNLVSDPIGIPMDFDGMNYSVSVSVAESAGVVSLNSSYISFNWKVPSKNGFSDIEYFKSGSVAEFKVDLKVRQSLDKSLLFLAIFMLECILIVATLRKQIRTFFGRLVAAYKIDAVFSQKIHFILLIIGLAGLVLLPASPPAGLLSSGTVDLKKVTGSDLIVKNEELNGGWLFRNSPNVKYNKEDYSTTLNFEIDVLLKPDNPDTELLAYGIPYGKESTPRSKKNLEVLMNSEPGFFFRIPSQRHQDQFYSKNLNTGVHRISGEIRSGREWQLEVDQNLVYAMSSQVPFILQQDPNLFVSEYLLDNLVAGTVSWEVAAEAATPIKYALHRIHTMGIFVLLFLSVTLICIRTMRAKKDESYSNRDSLKVLRFSYLTFLSLSLVGALFWLLNIQPVSSLIAFTRNYPLFLPEFRFSDFYQIYISSQNQDPFSIAEVLYPPFGMLILDLIGFMSARQAVVVFLSLTMAAITAFFAKSVLGRSDLSRIDRAGVLVTTCLSFPVIYAIDRGNLDLLIAAILIFGVWFNSKTTNSYVPGILIGLASAIKIYPLFLLPIFYYQRRDLRLVVACLGTFSLLSVFGALRYNLQLTEFFDSVMVGSAGQQSDLNSALRWNGSFSALVTTVVRFFAPEYATQVWSIASGIKATFTMLLFSCFAALWLIKRRVDVTVFAIAWLSLMSLAFPVTGAYRFTVFLVAFAYLINVGIQQGQKLSQIGMLLGVIVSPVIFWFFGSSEVNTFTLIVPLATIAMILVITSITRKKKKHKLKLKVPARI